MAAPLTSRQSSLASQLLQKSSIAIRPSPCGSGLARDGSAADFKPELAGEPAPTERHRNLSPPPVGPGLPAMAAPLTSGRARWQASSYRKAASQSAHPPVGAGLPAMAALLVSRQSSLASQLLQRSIATRPSPCGSGLARDGGAAVFKAAPSDKHRYLHATFRSTCTRACPLAGHSRPAAALGFNSKPVLFYILATNP